MRQSSLQNSWGKDMIAWVTIMGLSIALLAVSAGARGPEPRMALVHMAIAAIVSIVLAYLAIRDTQKLIDSNARRSVIAASTARFMGMVWTWGALGLLITYATGILSWREWWQFFIAFFVAAGLCLFFSATLQKDADAGKDDETMLSLGRYLAIGQLVGMLIVMVGLVIDGKMQRYINPRIGWEDWAANNIFFFGAFALAAISLFAIRAQAPATDKSS